MKRNEKQVRGKSAAKKPRRLGHRFLLAFFSLLLVGVTTAGICVTAFAFYIKTYISPDVDIYLDSYRLNETSHLYYIDSKTGATVAGPDIVSRGFVYVRENEELISGARNVAMSVLDRYETISQSDWTAIKNGIKDEMHNYLLGQIKRNPMILPIIMET